MTELAGVGRDVENGKTVLSFSFWNSVSLGVSVFMRPPMTSLIWASKALLSWACMRLRLEIDGSRQLV
jgi:hypothetical protein